MGKQGPCYHCGVTSTPLWRNGPPEKPVLCNACGSRWRTKGSLTNYTPLHSRAELADSEDYKFPKVKIVPVKKETKMHKRKSYDYGVEVEGGAPNTDQNFRKVMEEDTSNRSSSGSAISYSESCAQFCAADGSELTGPAQSTVWDSLVPSRKRTCVSRPKQSPVEKLTKDLCSILHEQQQFSHLSMSSEEDLLLESRTLMDSFEMGHGGCLLKYSNYENREEESEASSFSVDKKSRSVSDAYSAVSSVSVSSGSNASGLLSVENGKAAKFPLQGVQESTKRDKSLQEKLLILLSSKSPLTTVDLRDVVSHEVFTRHLTTEEQHLLLKDLPSLDTVKPPESLKKMFETPQFLESISAFQQLLLDGIFDSSSSKMSNEECRVLKRLALVNLTKTKWVEQYQQLKDSEGKKDTGKVRHVVGSNCRENGILDPYKRPHHVSNQKYAEAKVALKSPKLVQNGGKMIIPPMRASHANSSCGSLKANNEKDMDMENQAYCLSPRSLLSFPPDRCSSALFSLQFSNETSDHDLLFDVPSNASFPQAELLDSHLWKSKESV